MKGERTKSMQRFPYLKFVRVKTTVCKIGFFWFLLLVVFRLAMVMYGVDGLLTLSHRSVSDRSSRIPPIVTQNFLNLKAPTKSKSALRLHPIKSLLQRRKLPRTNENSTEASSSNRYRKGFFHESFSDFLFGANFIHQQYLSILWNYSAVQSMMLTVPCGILLWASYLYAPSMSSILYNMIYYPLYSMWTLSSWLASVLHLPLNCAKWVLSCPPPFLTGVVEYLPNVVAVPFVRTVLSVRDISTKLAATTRRYHFASVLSSVITLLFWRPAIEEWEYRLILNNLLLLPLGMNLLRIRNHRISSAPLVKYIPIEDSDDAEGQSSQIGRAQGAAVASEETSQQQANTSLPLTYESTSIFLGSVLLAATRLGWLSWDPTSGDHSSPYSWTIGFLQSVMAHFSSQTLSEVKPSLRIWILLLSIHQTLSTFLVTQNVFSKLFRERGLAASTGAHIAWTVSKGTVPFRLLWKLWLWLSNSTWTLRLGRVTRNGGSTRVEKNMDV